MDAQWQDWAEFDEPHMAHVKAILVETVVKSVIYTPDEEDRILALFTRMSYEKLMMYRDSQIGVDLAEHGDYGDYSAYVSLTPNAREVYHDDRTCGATHFEAYLTANAMYPHP